jgi:hypothetical protein
LDGTASDSGASDSGTLDVGTPDGGGLDSSPSDTASPSDAGSDAGPTAPVQGTYPGTTPHAVTAARIDQFMVAPDERHLAIGNGVSTGQLPFLGTLEMLTVGTSISMPTTVGSSVSWYWSAFTPDSHLLFVDNVSGGNGDIGDLEIVGPDGTGKRTLATGTEQFVGSGQYAHKAFQLAGNTVFFDQGAHAMSCALPDGTPVDLDPGATSELTMADPTGASVVVAEPAGVDPTQQAFYLVPAGGGPKTQILAMGTGLGDPSWSSDGQWFFFAQGVGAPMTPGVPMIVKHDGTGLSSVAPSYERFAGFGPNDQLAYATSTSQGDTLVIHPLSGGADVTIASAGVPLSGASIFFSADWSHGFLTWSDSGGPGTAYAAPVGTGTFTQIATNLQYGFGGCAPSLDGTHCAALMQGGTVAVLASDGSSPLTVTHASDGLPLYEPAAPGRLLVFGNGTPIPNTLISVGDLFVAASDGTSLVKLPGAAQSNDASWLRAHVIYPVNIVRGADNSPTSFDIAAATDDGQVTGTLATHAASFNWREGGSRIFFAATPAAGGAFWYVDLPAR